MSNILEYYPKMSERQFKSSTGYSKAEFAALCKDFEGLFFEIYKCTYQTYLDDRVMEKVKLPKLENCLFFVMYQLKNDLVYDSLGATFQMSGSTAHDNFKKYLGLLKQTLEKKKSIPNGTLRV